MKSVLTLCLASLLSVPFASLAVEQQTPASPQPNPPAPVTPGIVVPQAPVSNSGAQIIAEVSKMIQSRANPGVVKSYIQNWNTPFVLSADDILHLRDLGASTDILTSLIQRSAQLAAQNLPMAPPAPSEPDLVSTNPPPAVLYPYPGTMPGGTNSAAYPVPYPYEMPSYTYPTYSYPSYGSYPAYTYSYMYPYAPYVGYPYYSYWGFRPFFYLGGYYGGYYHQYRPYSYYGYRGYGYRGYYGHGYALPFGYGGYGRVGGGFHGGFGRR